MTKSEKSVQTSIEEYLKSLGGKVYYERRLAGGFGYKPGIPDLFAVCRGIHIEIEVKRPRGGRLDASQIKWRSRLKAAGAIYIEAKSLGDVKPILSGLLEGKAY